MCIRDREVLTRLGEMGLRVEDGAIVFRTILLRESEWSGAPGAFDYVDVHGRSRSLSVPAGSLAFTFCQVPVRYRRAEDLAVRVHLADGTVVDCPGGRIAPDLSDGIFRRLGVVDLIEVDAPERGVA